MIAAPPCFPGMGPVSCQSCIQTPPPLRAWRWHVSPVSPPLSTSRKGWVKSRVVAFCRELRYFYRMSDVKPVSCKKRKRGAAQVKHCSQNEWNAELREWSVIIWIMFNVTGLSNLFTNKCSAPNVLTLQRWKWIKLMQPNNQLTTILLTSLFGIGLYTRM